MTRRANRPKPSLANNANRKPRSLYGARETESRDTSHPTSNTLTSTQLPSPRQYGEATNEILACVPDLLCIGCGVNNKYECVERTEKEVLGFPRTARRAELTLRTYNSFCRFHT